MCIAASQQTSPTDTVSTAVATAITTEFVIDGLLDEAPWRLALRIGDLVQRIPVAGAVPPEKTEITLLYDEENLYIGVMCYDAEPHRVLASQMARAASLNANDRLGIVLDTFRSYGYSNRRFAGVSVDLCFGMLKLFHDPSEVRSVSDKHAFHGSVIPLYHRA